jgi:hypothetical protein
MNLNKEGSTVSIALVLSVCLVTDTTQCKDVVLTYLEDNITPMQCVMRAQPEIAKWIEEHPKWTQKKWTCVREKELTKKDSI